MKKSHLRNIREMYKKLAKTLNSRQASHLQTHSRSIPCGSCLCPAACCLAEILRNTRETRNSQVFFSIQKKKILYFQMECTQQCRAYPYCRWPHHQATSVGEILNTYHKKPLVSSHLALPLSTLTCASSVQHHNSQFTQESQVLKIFHSTPLLAVNNFAGSEPIVSQLVFQDKF